MRPPRESRAEGRPSLHSEAWVLVLRATAPRSREFACAISRPPLGVGLGLETVWTGLVSDYFQLLGLVMRRYFLGDKGRFVRGKRALRGEVGLQSR